MQHEVSHHTQTHAIFTKYQYLKNEQSTVIMYSMQFHMETTLEPSQMSFLCEVMVWSTPGPMASTVLDPALT